MLLSVVDKLDHYQILDWCHYGDDIRLLPNSEWDKA